MIFSHTSLAAGGKNDESFKGLPVIAKATTSKKKVAHKKKPKKCQPLLPDNWIFLDIGQQTMVAAVQLANKPKNKNI